MKILVIGGGGREHALCWKLRQSPRVTELYCAPGNAGTEMLGRNVPVTDPEGLARFAQEERIELTVVGPDDALAGGIVDLFESRGLRIFGPSKAGARFESSKAFAKRFMERHGIGRLAARRIASANLVSNYTGTRIVFCQPAEYPLPPGFKLLRFRPTWDYINADVTKTQVRIFQFTEHLRGKLLPHQKIKWNSGSLAKTYTCRQIVRRGIRGQQDYPGCIGIG